MSEQNNLTYAQQCIINKVNQKNAQRGAGARSEYEELYNDYNDSHSDYYDATPEELAFIEKTKQDSEKQKQQKFAELSRMLVNVGKGTAGLIFLTVILGVPSALVFSPFAIADGIKLSDTFMMGMAIPAVVGPLVGVLSFGYKFPLAYVDFYETVKDYMKENFNSDNLAKKKIDLVQAKKDFVADVKEECANLHGKNTIPFWEKVYYTCAYMKDGKYAVAYQPYVFKKPSKLSFQESKKIEFDNIDVANAFLTRAYKKTIWDGTVENATVESGKNPYYFFAENNKNVKNHAFDFFMGGRFSSVHQQLFGKTK